MTQRRKPCRKTIRMLDERGSKIKRRYYGHLKTAVQRISTEVLSDGQTRILYDEDRGIDLCTVRASAAGTKTDVHAPRVFKKLLTQ